MVTHRDPTDAQGPWQHLGTPMRPRDLEDTWRHQWCQGTLEMPGDLSDRHQGTLVTLGDLNDVKGPQ